ncbi:MAG: 23S rRNA (adenine(2503)-C(2))-methyltransferase RlmN [Tissierellia bacterium]|nr:23S rRNA (adenine(2503)-C(2))-methyltransferase RlmN [Tissierellia bacterium]
MELNNLSYEALSELIVSLGEKKFRTEQLFKFMHQQNGKSIQKLNVFSKELRDSLSLNHKIDSIKILQKYNSKLDDTIKYLFLLEDNNIIEGVVMKYAHGYSMCISSQVGCKMGCSFCASTKEGLIRNLKVSEMLNQIYMAEEDLNIRISNIVLMGSGEPLDNYKNVISFIRIINHNKGRNISLRNITLSTCGIVPKIYELADEMMPITLSISLHSPFDDKRAEIMPIAKKYKLKDVIKALKYYYEKTNRRITFEYTVIEGLNDTEADANEIAKLCEGLLAHVNLITLNPIKEFDKERPSKKTVVLFQQKLLKLGIQTTIRAGKGSDISASCGQLRRGVLNDLI